jgi:hypothetical protein
MISILLATTGRPDMAEACVRGVFETAESYEVEVIAAVDVDSTTVARLSAVDRDRVTISYAHHYRGCSRAWNDALRLSKGDPVVLAADDLEWHLGWLENGLERLSQLPGGWGLVGFNDGHWGEELATHYLVSRRFIVEVLGGVIAWECYRHSFNDVEITERAKRAGRYAWCEDARVHHSHWLFGGRPQDATDARNLTDYSASQAVYMQRAAAGFPNDYEPVIAA